MDNIRDINHVYLLQWFGPFQEKDECKEWLKKNNADEKEFYFYIIIGKEKFQRKFSFYCGISEQDQIYKRWNKEHVLNSFVRDKEIWIARFSDNRLRNVPKEDVHNIVELVEHALIYYMSNKMNMDCYVSNEKKTMSIPKESIFIINQWYNKNTNDNFIRRISIAPKSFPDVITFDNEYIGEGLWKISDRLKNI